MYAYLDKPYCYCVLNGLAGPMTKVHAWYLTPIEEPSLGKLYLDHYIETYANVYT